jgi:hypothetical protein
MKTRASISLLSMIVVILAACAPKPAPGQIVGAPDPVFYGACSPHSVAFIYELPSEDAGKLDPVKNSVTAEYRLIGTGGIEVAKNSISLTSAGGAYTGTLDLNPLGPLLEEGEGSLVFYGQVWGSWPFMRGSLPFKTTVYSDSKVVDVQPCLPTPIPTLMPTPTATPTPIPEPTKKPKSPPPCSVEPNNPNCIP